MPKAFIPAYPRGLSFGMAVGSRSLEGRRLWKRYWDNAVEIPDAATEALGKAACEAGVHLAVGVFERDRHFGRGTLTGNSSPTPPNVFQLTVNERPMPPISLTP